MRIIKPKTGEWKSIFLFPSLFYTVNPNTEALILAWANIITVLWEKENNHGAKLKC